MSHKLLIRLKNSTDGTRLLEWLIIFDDGRTQSSSHTDINEDLQKYADTAQQIIALVPSADIFMTQIKLPKLSPARLAKAIPFALEDQLTDDVANVHFALHNTKGNDLTSVAVVDKETMNQWRNILISMLGNTAQNVKVLLPDVLALPWQNGIFYILIDDEMALVRTGKSTGFSIEKKELFTVLMLYMKQSGQGKPDSIQIDNASSGKLFSDEEAVQLGMPIQTTAIHHSLLDYMSERLKEPVVLNLFQGSYAPAHKKITMDQLIWACMGILSAWMIVVTLADISQYFILNHVRNSLSQEMQTLYARIYPNTKAPENPKASLQKELDNLRASRSDSSFIRLLNMVGPRFSELNKSEIWLNGMAFRNNLMILNVEANDSTIIDQLRQSLELQGLKVVVSNAERSASGMIETRLTVEEMH